MPIFVNEGSVFTQMTQQDPRLSIERVLVEMGEDPTRFIEPFMRMWDDDQFRTRVGCTAATELDIYGPTSYAWHLLRELETDLSSCRRGTLASNRGYDEQKRLAHLRNTVTKLTTASLEHQPVSSQQSARSSFEYIVRRISPLLCCAALLELNADDDQTVKSCAEHIEQLFYGFPILCCGPFAEMMMVQKDSRTLVFLSHFYRAARVLLEGRCWWASARSRIIILEEFETRRIVMIMI
jgi:hypothetical protein